MPGSMPLEKELAYFAQHKDKLLQQYKGKFVLIKDKTLVGVYDTDAEAYRVGVEKFGNQPFLVKQVLDDKEEQVFSPALTLGLIHVNL